MTITLALPFIILAIIDVAFFIYAITREDIDIKHGYTKGLIIIMWAIFSFIAWLIYGGIYWW